MQPARRASINQKSFSLNITAKFTAGSLAPTSGEKGRAAKGLLAEQAQEFAAFGIALQPIEPKLNRPSFL